MLKIKTLRELKNVKNVLFLQKKFENVYYIYAWKCSSDFPKWRSFHTENMKSA